MSKTYSPYGEHTWVLVKHPKCIKPGARGEFPSDQPFWEDEAWRGPCRIVLHTDTHVWVDSSYSAEGHPEVNRVGDGRSNGYDQVGNCILSVPVAWCEEYYTDQEANDVFMAMDADERLKDYM